MKIINAKVTQELKDATRIAAAFESQTVSSFIKQLLENDPRVKKHIKKVGKTVKQM